MAIHNPVGPSRFPPAPSAGRRWLVVSFHGLAPHTQRPCQELLTQLAELGVPRATLLMAPHGRAVETILECPFFLRWLRSLAAAGHEIRMGQGSEILAAAGVPAQGPEPRLAAPTVAFSTRNALHRAVSPLIARARFAAARKQPVLRIAVHPNDLYERRVRHALVAILRGALVDRRPVTCGELAEAAAPSQI
jgi:predicted deacetylase